MQREVSTVKAASLLTTLVAAALLAATTLSPSAATAAQAQVNTKVPAGKWKAVRLKNLPEGASLSVKVVASASLIVMLVHEAELKNYPKPASPAFQGTLETTLSFSVVIPEAGNYYIIFDNRRGSDERSVRVLIRANAPSRTQPAPGIRSGPKQKI
jgi:hypothetical protein